MRTGTPICARLLCVNAGPSTGAMANAAWIRSSRSGSPIRLISVLTRWSCASRRFKSSGVDLASGGRTQFGLLGSAAQKLSHCAWLSRAPKRLANQYLASR